MAHGGDRRLSASCIQIENEGRSSLHHVVCSIDVARETLQATSLRMRFTASP